MRVLLDINVLLDAMLQRAPWHLEADAVLAAAARGQVTCATTTLSLATLFYVGRKVVGTTAARAGVRRYLGFCSKSQTLNVLLELADARRLPSPLKLTLKTGPTLWAATKVKVSW